MYFDTEPPSHFPIPLETPRLLLRSPRPGDGIFLHEAARESRKEFAEFMPWAWETNACNELSEIFVHKAAENWIQKKNEEPWFQFIIEKKETHQIIGNCSLHQIDWEVPCFEIGYWLRTSQTGHGFMTEAINKLTRFLFDEMHAERVEIRCDSHNFPSQAVPLRLGYQHEATLKSNRIDPGTGYLSDTLIFVRHDAAGLPSLKNQ